MSERGIAELLAETRLFEGLAEPYRELIAGCGQITAFEPGALFRQGEPANDFFLLRHGRVALEIFVPGRGPVMIETIGPGDVVGWSWLFEPYTWHLDARVLERSSAIVFDGACLRGKCEEDSRLGYELMHRFAIVMLDRLQATRLRLLDVYSASTAGVPG